MDYQSVGVLHDKDGKDTRNKATEVNLATMDEKDISKPTPGFQREHEQVNAVDQDIRETVPQDAALGNVDTYGEVNMEATITPDDVVRAGGFGARDDISSFLPVPTDSTDFEASIRDAQDYEQPQEEVRRPGSWVERGTLKRVALFVSYTYLSHYNQLF